jgi:hypothetical protein
MLYAYADEVLPIKATQLVCSIKKIQLIGRFCSFFATGDQWPAGCIVLLVEPQWNLIEIH